MGFWIWEMQPNFVISRESGKSSKDLAHAINSLVSSPEKIRGMSLKARERVEKHYSWNNIVCQALEFYKKLVGKT
jgi:glycosyltransferase involved in cell wall biosynthesis